MPLRRLLLAGTAAVGLALPTLSEAQGPARTVADLNLRTGPGTNHPQITVIPRGAPVHVHGCQLDVTWCELTFGGVTGWASADYLDAGPSDSYDGFPHHPGADERQHAGGAHYTSNAAEIPPGHLPPPGECRVWYPERPAGHQPPPYRC